MTTPIRPSAADALAQLRARRPSAAEALARLRGGDPSFADVTGGASSQAEAPMSYEDIVRIRDSAETQALADVGTSMVQGATYNFGDNLGLTNRADVERVAKEHPILNVVGEGIGMTLNPLSRLGFGGGRGARIIAGAAHGAVAGAGANDEDPARGAAVGGAFGGTATLGFETAALLAKWAMMLPNSKVADAAMRLIGVPRPVRAAVAGMVRTAEKAPTVLDDAAQAVELPGVVRGEAPAIDAAIQALPDAVPTVGPKVREPWPAGPGVREGFPRQRPPLEAQPAPPRLTPAPTPPPRLGPAAMVAELERDPAFATSRGTGGQPVPPPPSIRSPAAMADAVEYRPARKVPAGPYQKAAPATRMDSGLPQSAAAEKMVDNPEQLISQIELMQSLGVEPHPRMLQALAEALDRRGMDPTEVPAYIARLSRRVLPAGDKPLRGIAAMSDADLTAHHTSLMERAQRDAMHAAQLDELEAMLEHTSTGRKMGYQRAKELLGSAEDARRWANVSEEAFGALQDRGLTPQDLRAMYAARARAGGAQRDLTAATNEMERRGLLDPERLGIQEEAGPLAAPRPGTPMTGDVPFSLGNNGATRLKMLLGMTGAGAAAAAAPKLVTRTH